MFNWFKSKAKQEREDKEKLMRLELNAFHGTVRAAEKQSHQAVEMLKDLKYEINRDMKDELDTTQRKYIALLEGKLIQFDEEARRIKAEKDAQYQRLHNYFYSGARP
jgi:septal ring factor EnvC (AmiA/AmiB activator)